MSTDLVQFHHASYLDDIPFWISLTSDRDPILELGCGHGRVTLPLLESGRKVTGLDRDPAALSFLANALASRSQELQDRARLVEADILEYQDDLVYGTVIIPCNTLSTFKPQERQALFTLVFDLLEKGGLLAASLPNPVQQLAEWNQLLETGEESELELESVFNHPDSGLPVQVSSRLEAKGEELRWDWIYDQLFPDGRILREVVSTTHYPTSRDTYLSELTEVGFQATSALGDFDSCPYSETSPYLILVSTR